MLDVSAYLDSEQVFKNGRGLPSVGHEVALETAGPALAAVIIAGVLEGGSTSIEIAHRLIVDLCNHLKGRKGNEPPSQQQLNLADAIGDYANSGVIRGPKRKALVDECLSIGTARLAARFSGDPGEDWLTVRRLFENALDEALTQVGLDAKYLRLLHRGAMLRAKLGEIWRTNGNYLGSTDAVREALLQEHFAASIKDWRGVHVMTIHKSKGKEFEEVIIYEDSHQGRIARVNANEREFAQARLALRVGVTRAKKRATILTPQHDPCPFL
jgi:DNA helicase-2/ATP-dependent DNA helicase PcrA